MRTGDANVSDGLSSDQATWCGCLLAPSGVPYWCPSWIGRWQRPSWSNERNAICKGIVGDSTHPIQWLCWDNKVLKCKGSQDMNPNVYAQMIHVIMRLLEPINHLEQGILDVEGFVEQETNLCNIVRWKQSWVHNSPEWSGWIDLRKFGLIQNMIAVYSGNAMRLDVAATIVSRSPGW